jgi:AcrR family transcriptional regulator
VAQRSYRLGRRQASVDRTAASILVAARELVAGGSRASVGEIARRAGVSRITVYNRFGSRARVLESLVPARSDRPATDLRQRIFESCARWAADPALYRRLPTESKPRADRELAERMAAADQLRPGCSIREAEDVIGALTSFAVFDRLHGDGRRPVPVVAEVLMRLAAGILA